MVFEEFVTKIRELVEELMGDDVEVLVQEVPKNNGVVLTGIVIRKEEENITPTIYLNSFFQIYQEQHSSDDYDALLEIAREVIRQYEECHIEGDIDFSYLSDFEAVKDRIAFKLVNYVENAALLQEVPHDTYLDLAVLYYVVLERGYYENATMLIQNSHLKMWGVTKAEIAQYAKENTPRLFPYKCKSLVDVVEEIIDLSDVMQEHAQKFKIYVLYTEGFGASVMLYERLLKDFASALGSDLIIIPSSIHELIVLAYDKEDDIARFNEMVHEVNEEAVSIEERLSDHIYVYDRKRGEVVNAM